MQNSNKPVLRIRAIRESKGYTQEYMAEMLGICQSTYAHLESGKTRLSVDRWIQIAGLLEVPLDALIDHPPSLKEGQAPNQKSHSTSAAGIDGAAQKMYDVIIEEMRQEIQFLRSLIRPTGQ